MGRGGGEQRKREEVVEGGEVPGLECETSRVEGACVLLGYGCRVSPVVHPSLMYHEEIS